MNTKLTLTIEKEVIENAKKYASKTGQSLSDLVENYFKLLTGNKRMTKPTQLSPRVRKLRGVLKVDGPLDYKEILTQELSKKYGT